MSSRRLSILFGASLTRRVWFGAAVVLGAATSSSASGCAGATDIVRSAHSDAPLRLERVVLYENGLAHLERRGHAPNGELDLVVPAAQVDDVIRSLTVVGATERAAITGVRLLPAEAGTDVTLRVGLRNEGDGEIRVSYVTEASAWRPSYRLVVGADRRVHVQGLAVIDNPTSEAWQDVALTLSTEVPFSFRFDLRDARTSYRPHFDANGHLVRDETAERDAPIAALGLGNARPASEVNLAYGLAQRDLPERSTRAGMRVGDATPSAGEGSGSSTASRGASGAMLAFEEHTNEEGGVFSSVPGFDLGRGESGLVPFVDTTTEGEIALVFKPSPGGALSAVHPYRSVLFRNPSDAALLTGPVSIYADDRFVGDGVTGAIPGHAHAFVPFAIERSITVDRVSSATEAEVRGTSLAGGVLTLSLEAVRHEGFVMHATHAIDETAYAFVENVPGFAPRTLPEGAIVTPQGVFAPVHFASDGRGEIALDLVQQTTSTVSIASEPDARYVPALLALLGDRPEAPRLRVIADRLFDLRSELGRVEDDLRVERVALDERREAMEALRSVTSASVVRTRLSTSIADGVSRVDQLTTEASALHAEDIALRQEWYGLLRALRR
ncbi:MAG: DUF4139 domain-containing protein [Deltaproteobacteria bacterium]|nr:DUF4139 domain-containing protein [Deltaproteobacteria bacterium]